MTSRYADWRKEKTGRASGDVIWHKGDVLIRHSHRWYWRPRSNPSSKGGVDQLWWLGWYFQVGQRPGA